MAWPIEAYLAEREPVLAPRTIATYRAVLRRAEAFLACAPDAISSTRLAELSRSWGHRDQNLSALRTFLAWTGSPSARQVPRGIPPGSRRQMTWYTTAELEAIVSACLTPRERLIVHLACELMLRRVEIERLCWEDLEPTSITVHGKGRHGGKVRRIPWHPYTRPLVTSWSASRGAGSTAGRAGAPWGPTSSPSRAGSIVGLRKSALDKELKTIEAGLRYEGVSMSLEFHALRRTGARLFLEAAAKIGKGPLEALNELRGILGHEDLRTTLLYVGWDLGSAGATMAAMPRLENRTAPAGPSPRRPPMDRVGFVTARTRTAPKTPPTS